ncbi:MAG TPA: glutamate--tRNA ligase [Atribacteraceae bacterium]|nr:glutamate--tRNA ligase [Atribacteraceae bacterium]
MADKVRVRFAPSPTGFLHLGGARTSLFNWVFARKSNGTFILRIEDTDAARSNEESVRAILEGLSWLGLCWDEGPVVSGPHEPYFQSERRPIYHQYARRLLQKRLAYQCYCSPEELAQRKEESLAHGDNWRYDRRCLSLAEENREVLARDRKPVLRFLVPDGETSLVDMLRGTVTFQNTELDDFVIEKSDGFPTYNFACVVDDVLMGITHVIRGDDHLSNTPRQVLLYQALDFPVPRFAHIPMILGKDKTRLSKRHGSPSLADYRDKGYLPEAMFNYLARLSWASGEEEQEIFSREEIIDRFSLDRVARHAAVFDLDKLNWMNGYYIREADEERLTDLLLSILKREGIKPPGDQPDDWRKYCRQVVRAMKPRIHYVAQIVEDGRYFFEETVDYDPPVFRKVLLEPGARERLEKSRERISELENVTIESLESVVRSLSEEQGVAAAKFIHPLRVATSGKKGGPGLFEMLEILGKDRILIRIARAIEQILTAKLSEEGGASLSL